MFNFCKLLESNWYLSFQLYICPTCNSLNLWAFLIALFKSCLCHKINIWQLFHLSVWNYFVNIIFLRYSFILAMAIVQVHCWYIACNGLTVRRIHFYVFIIIYYPFSWQLSTILDIIPRKCFHWLYQRCVCRCKYCSFQFVFPYIKHSWLCIVL